MAIIVISGMPGAGSSTNARLLAQRLGLRHISGGDFFKQKALEYGINKPETEKATSFMKTKLGSDKGFHIKLDDMMKKELKKGDVVMDGKLAIRMMKGVYNLGVWLKASDSIRSKRISGRDDLSEKEAKKIIAERDVVERKNFKKVYGFDTFEQEKEAGIVIDTGGKTPKQITDIIIKELNR